MKIYRLRASTESTVALLVLYTMPLFFLFRIDIPWIFTVPVLFFFGHQGIRLIRHQTGVVGMAHCTGHNMWMVHHSALGVLEMHLLSASYVSRYVVILYFESMDCKKTVSLFLYHTDTTPKDWHQLRYVVACARLGCINHFFSYQ